VKSEILLDNGLTCCNGCIPWLNSYLRQSARPVKMIFQ